MAPETKATYTKQRLLLWGSLLITLGLVYWQWSIENADGSMDDSMASDLPRAKQVFRQTLKSVQPTISGNQRPLDELNSQTSSADTLAFENRLLPALRPEKVLFAAHAWVAPPPKLQLTPPSLPKAPAIPYSYVGSLQDMPDGNTVMMMQQTNLVLLKIGQSVNRLWRLDREDAQAVYFTYLPLNQVVVLHKNKKEAIASQRPLNVAPLENLSSEP